MQNARYSTHTIMLNAIRDFLKLETTSGLILVGAAVLAMIVANSPLASIYASLIDTPVEIRIGGFEIAKPLLLWVNDGLMAIFFFLIGLELKREVLAGELSDPKEVVLPCTRCARRDADSSGHLHLDKYWG